MDKWINVSERLPEPETHVLVAFDDSEVTSLWQNWGNLTTTEDNNPLEYVVDIWSMKYHTVTHWMPLPEPPKEG